MILAERRRLAALAPLAAVLWSLVASTPAFAASLGSQTTWQYAIEWRLIRAGTATMKWKPDAGAYNAELGIQSTGLVSKLYRVNDEYRARMSEALCASAVSIIAEEGKRRRDTTVSFTDSKATYTERDLIKNKIVLTKDTPLTGCVHEYLGAIQWLRMQRIEVGKSAQAPLSDGKKVASVRVDAQEREEVETPLGKFKAIRYEVHMFNDVLINKKARLFVWLSDDDRRLPVQIRVRMQFLIGTIELKLEKQE